MGLAAASAVGAAHAQETVADRQAVRAETPWYERFTYSPPALNGGSTALTDRRPSSTWVQDGRWSVRVDAQENRGPAALSPAPRDSAALGAFYQFTPRLRVGGQVTVAEPPTRAQPPVNREEPSQPDAGVKLESAFRF
jgi:hypothetical protein